MCGIYGGHNGSGTGIPPTTVIFSVTIPRTQLNYFCPKCVICLAIYLVFISDSALGLRIKKNK
jgi:hypothetical protein